MSKLDRCGKCGIRVHDGDLLDGYEAEGGQRGHHSCDNGRMTPAAFIERDEHRRLVPTCFRHDTVWRGPATFLDEAAKDNVRVHNIDAHGIDA